MEANEYKIIEKEEKRLLLKSLCESLPNHTICHTHNGDYKLLGIDIEREEVRLDAPIYDEGDGIYELHCYGDVMPYLRPIESMTEKERKEYDSMVFDYEYDDLVEWYIEHHFDYRGLIPMGLALPAPDGMYETQNR